MRKLTICGTRIDPFESVIVAVAHAVHVLAMAFEQGVQRRVDHRCSSRISVLVVLERHRPEKYFGAFYPRVEPTCRHVDGRIVRKAAASFCKARQASGSCDARQR